VIDVTHDRHDGRSRHGLLGAFGAVSTDQQLVLHRRLFNEFDGVAHFLDDENCGVLVDDLVDRDHHPHSHQHLDDFRRFDGEPLRQITDGYGFGYLDLTNYGRSRPFKRVLWIHADV
jgi:hypothetical protein